MNSNVTAIIASTGRVERAGSLVDAVESLENQKDVDLKIVIVFNGPNVDLSLRVDFEKRPGLVVKYQNEPSLPKALHYGRTLVDTEYFCFLDDDDVYIPDTLRLRCKVLNENPDVDVVACNGYVYDGLSRSLLFPETLSLFENPLRELFKQNWLASCGGLFRTRTIDKRYFRKDVKYYEWTMTAFLIALDRRVAFLNVPTFTINHTEGSLSTSKEYVNATPAFLRSLLCYPIPPDIKKIIRQRRADSFHNISAIHLKRKNYKQAWNFHLKSLLGPNKLKYISYTRKLVG